MTNNKVGIIIETGKNRVKNAVFGMITLAKKQNFLVYAFVSDVLTLEIKKELEDYGINNIVDINIADNKNPVLLANAFVKVIEDFEIDNVFGLSIGFSKDILARMAAKVFCPLVLDCVDVNLKDKIAVRSQYSGKTMANIKLEGKTSFFGIRPNSITPQKQSSDTKVLPFLYDVKEMDSFLIVSDDAKMKSSEQKNNLVEADIIIAGGRGMKNKENFDLLFECAKKMNACVGASRVAVDSNWVPYSMQIGQTGEKVSPQVYLACGISGSIQHFAGMKTSKIIIAINHDPDAPIMSNCNYFVNADLFKIIDELIKQL